MVEDMAFARYFSEFLGTFVLVFTAGCSMLSGQTAWVGAAVTCAIVVMTFALGKSSGAHFNPAVSLAAGLAGKLSLIDMVVYWCVQIMAGILAGMASIRMYEDSVSVEPGSGFDSWQAFAVEAVYTCMLAFVVLNSTACEEHEGRSQFYGIAIGLAVLAGAHSAGSISMGCFNPAVALGFDVSRRLGTWSSVHWYSGLYSAAEIIGGGVAALLFIAVRPKERRSDPTEARILQAKLLSEFFGTFMLMLTVGLTVLASSPAASLPAAAALACMVFAVGSVSGAHFNPAVTVAVVSTQRGKLSMMECGLYIGVQLIAGVCAAFSCKSLHGGKSFPLRPADSGWQQVLVAEFVFTFVLAFVVLSVATVKQDRLLTEYFGLAIGTCVGVGGLAVGKISGAALNPAVSIGITSVQPVWGEFELESCGFYCGVQLMAGALAAGAFFCTQPSEYYDQLRKHTYDEEEDGAPSDDDDAEGAAGAKGEGDAATGCDEEAKAFMQRDGGGACKPVNDSASDTPTTIWDETPNPAMSLDNIDLQFPDMEAQWVQNQAPCATLPPPTPQPQQQPLQQPSRPQPFAAAAPHLPATLDAARKRPRGGGGRSAGAGRGGEGASEDEEDWKRAHGAGQRGRSSGREQCVERVRTKSPEGPCYRTGETPAGPRQQETPRKGAHRYGPRQDVSNDGEWETMS